MKFSPLLNHSALSSITIGINKLRNALALVLVLTLALALTGAPALASDLCWKTSDPRGAGTIPKSCTGGKGNETGLCYTPCEEGQVGNAFLCWSKCPAGWYDHGVGCTKPAPYGRGAGYPWHFGDWLNSDGMMSRCEANEDNGCEMDGAIAYPKCKPGFHNVGCCICSPDCPEKFTDTGATCIKPTENRGVGTIPDKCDNGKEYDAGLCYRGCQRGFYGVGPVCWQQCPASHPIACGAACATSSDACARETIEMVTSVLEIATDIATGGAGAAASAGAKTLTKVGVKAATKAAVKAMKEKVKHLTRDEIEKHVGEAMAEYAKKVGENLSKDSLKEMTEKMIDKLTEEQKHEPKEEGEHEDDAFDSTVFDPTGIASVVKAYNHPMCSVDPLPVEEAKNQPNQPNQSFAPAQQINIVANKLHDPKDELADLYARLSVAMAQFGRKHRQWIDAPDKENAPKDPGRGISDIEAHRYWARYGANRGQIASQLASRWTDMQAYIEHWTILKPDGTYDEKLVLNDIGNEFVVLYTMASVEIAKLGQKYLDWKELNFAELKGSGPYGPWWPKPEDALYRGSTKPGIYKMFLWSNSVCAAPYETVFTIKGKPVKVTCFNNDFDLVYVTQIPTFIEQRMQALESKMR